MFVDDGHLHAENYRLISFHPNDKFPDGRETVEMPEILVYYDWQDQTVSVSGDCAGSRLTNSAASLFTFARFKTDGRLSAVPTNTFRRHQLRESVHQHQS